VIGPERPFCVIGERINPTGRKKLQAELQQGDLSRIEVDVAQQVELADMLDLEPITLCRIIDRLEESGLVERSRDPADRRAWRLHVTAKAQPLIEKLHAVGAELVSEAFVGIDPKEIEITRKVLAQARENASRCGAINRASNQ
jgi:DNA-binding MarR family transcriptional regulator